MTDEWMPEFARPSRQQDPEAIELAPNANSLDLLQAVYRSNDLPLHTRMRAAMAALKHEVPALAVQALITEQDIATVLDRRIANYERMKLLDQKTITQPPTNSNGGTNQQNVDTPPIDLHTKPTPAPLARLYNTKLYRRF